MRVRRRGVAAPGPDETVGERCRHEVVTVRLARVVDRSALLRLTELDCAPAPQGEMVVAEVEGRVLAAVALDGHRAIADPFSCSAELVALVRFRAEQLRPTAARRGT